MLSLKKGDVLVRKDNGHKYTVVIALDGGTFAEDFDGVSNWWGDREMKEYFTLPTRGGGGGGWSITNGQLPTDPTEKWVPKENEDYYVVALYSIGPEPALTHWDNGSSDRARLDSGNCFRTREEAENKAEEIRKVLKK